LTAHVLTCTVSLVEEAGMAEGAERYTLDGEPVDLEELLTESDLTPGELEDLEALEVGEAVLLGHGGAWAVFELRRVA
jgi:hypothetical protein